MNDSPFNKRYVKQKSILNNIIPTSKPQLITRDMVFKSNCKLNNRISKSCFLEYFDLPEFLLDKLFYSLCESKLDNEIPSQKVENFLEAYISINFEEMVTLCFNLLDFNEDGFVSKTDYTFIINLITSYDDKIIYNEEIRELKHSSNLKFLLFSLFGKHESVDFSTFMGRSCDIGNPLLLLPIHYFILKIKEIYEGIEFTLSDEIENRPSKGTSKFLFDLASISSPKLSNKTRKNSPVRFQLNFQNNEKEDDVNTKDDSSNNLKGNNNNEVLLKKINQKLKRTLSNIDDSQLLNTNNKTINVLPVLESPIKNRKVLKKMVTMNLPESKDIRDDEKFNTPSHKPSRAFTSSYNLPVLTVSTAYTSGSLPNISTPLASRSSTKSLVRVTLYNVFLYRKKNDKLVPYSCRLINKKLLLYHPQNKRIMKLISLINTYIKPNGRILHEGENYYAIEIFHNTESKTLYMNELIDYNMLINQLNQQDKNTHRHVCSDTMLGKGQFSKVILGEFDNEKVSIKLTTRPVNVAELQSLRREEHVLRLCDHPCVLPIVYKSESWENVAFIQEYFPSVSLDAYFHINNYELSEDYVKEVARQLLDCLYHLHKKGIVHRDLKPENILINLYNPKEIRLVDFGFSRFIAPGEMIENESFGTLIYASPEILNNEPYDSTVDLYSLGVLIFYLLSGEFPFTGSEKEIREKILYYKIDFGKNSKWKRISNKAKSFVQGLISFKTKRMSIKLAKQHEWLL